MITPLNAINRTENFGYTVQKSPLNDISANNMPNGLLRVPHIDNSKNMNSHNVNEYKNLPPSSCLAQVLHNKY